jgi:hypothetical protein
MDEDEHRIVHLDRIHETDRRGVVDGQGLDHLHLAGLKIDRAVNVDGLTPGRLFNREVLLARHPAAGGARAMGWLNRVRERHRFVIGQGIQELIVALDERLFLRFIALARNDVRLEIRESQTMQKRDQSRAAFISEPEFPPDKGADLACRRRQCRAYPRLHIVLLRHAQIACPPAHVKAGDAYDRALFEELAPAANRGVVKEQRLGDPLSKSTKACARRVTRQGGRPVTPQRSRRLAIFFAEEAGLNHARNRIRPITNRKNFSRLFNEPRYK